MKLIHRVACALILSTVLPGAALAQAGIAQNNEITTADAATKLLQPTTSPPPDLSKNGVDLTDSAPVSDPTRNTDGTDKAAYVAQAGPLTLLNCSGGNASVKSYNSNDSVLLIPYKTITIRNGTSGSPRCATKSCKLAVNGGKTGALSGYQVYFGAKVQATNAKSMARGCPAYDRALNSQIQGIPVESSPIGGSL